jgi:hypothetical protein
MNPLTETSESRPRTTRHTSPDAFCP